MSRSQLETLAGAYIEWAGLCRRGATTEAQALYQLIAGDFRVALEAIWSNASRALADGDRYAALQSLHTVLDIHQQNLLKIDLPITKAACFAQIGRVLDAMGQPRAASAARALVARDGDCFYRPSPSCQIAILGALFEQLFGQRVDGTFVEVGAYDGETFSNTSFLADLGWRGVYIEPVERAFKRCVERHRRNPRVSVLNWAIGPEETTIRFWDNGQFSTGSADEMAINTANAWIDPAGVAEIEVRQVRLDTTLRQAAVEPGFDLLVVDVDGMEEPVFESFALEHWRPRHMIVELLDHSLAAVGHERTTASSARVRAAIHRCGYEEIYRDQGNTVFGRRAAD